MSQPPPLPGQQPPPLPGSGVPAAAAQRPPSSGPSMPPPLPQQSPPGSGPSVPPNVPSGPTSRPSVPSPGQPSEPRRAKKRPVGLLTGLFVGVLVLAVALVLILPRLTGSGGLLSGSDEFSPQGPLTMWLDARYANGVTSWTTESSLVGVSRDREILATIEHVERRDTPTDLVGLAVLTGDEQWRVEAADCSSQGSWDGIAWCTRERAEGEEVLRVDLSTGESAAVYWAPFNLSGLKAVGEFEGLQLLLGSNQDDAGMDQVAFALTGDGGIAWQQVVPAFQDCALVGTHVVCNGLLGLIAYAAASGEPTVQVGPAAEGTLQTMDVATDGFVRTVVDTAATETSEIAYDYTGQPLGDWETSIAGPIPGDSNGCFYTLDDLARMDDIRAVDADGRVVADRLDDDGVLKLRPSGAALPAETGVVAVAADGSVVVVTNMQGEQPLVITADGTQVAELASAEGDLIGPFQGLLIGLATDLDGPTTIFAPIA